MVHSVPALTGGSNHISSRGRTTTTTSSSSSSSSSRLGDASSGRWALPLVSQLVIHTVVALTCGTSGRRSSSSNSSSSCVSKLGAAASGGMSVALRAFCIPSMFLSVSAMPVGGGMTFLGLTATGVTYMCINMQFLGHVHIGGGDSFGC